MRRGGSYLFALALIALGVFLLLRNIDVIPGDVSVWPFVLIAVGVVLLVGRLLSRWPHQGGFLVPVVLLTLGVFFLLQETEAVGRDVSVLPVVLIAIGAGLLLDALPIRRRPPNAVDVSVPAEGARGARLRINHGAGRLRIGGGAPAGTVVDGTVSADTRTEVERGDGTLQVRIRGGGGWVPWQGPLDWDLRLGSEVPLTIDLRTGANESTVDLSSVPVPELSLKTGASDTTLTVPAAGCSRVEIHAGAAGVHVRVPEGVAARIRARTGLAGLNVDEARFPKTGDGYASPGFEEAENRADIEIEGGVAGFDVR